MAQKSRFLLSALGAPLGLSLRNPETAKYTFDEFRARPVFADDDGIGDPTGATGDENIMQTEQYHYEYHILGAGQTILAPVFSASGLDISLDQTDNEGAEYTQGITARARAAQTVGEAKNLIAVKDGGRDRDGFFFRATLSIADVSGTDTLLVGWRKAEAYQADFNDYDEMAAINVNAGTLESLTILNGAATTTDVGAQTWADGETHTLEVRVSPNGEVTWFFDGTRQTDLENDFQFDEDEVVVPFIHFLHSADLAGAVNLQLWEAGTWRSRGITTAIDEVN